MTIDNSMDALNPKAIWPINERPLSDGQTIAGYTCPWFSSEIQREDHITGGFRVNQFVAGFNDRDELDDLPMCHTDAESLESLIRMRLHTRKKLGELSG